VPAPWIDIRNGLGKGPLVSGKIFDAVLAFAEWIVGGRPQDTGATLSSMLAVAVHVFHPDHGRVPAIGLARLATVITWFHQNHGPIAHVQLCSVVGDP
jgi:hypothetical protein